MSQTPIYNIDLPNINASNFTWGQELNDGIIALEARVDAAKTVADAALPLTGGTVTGSVTATGFIGPLTGAVTGNADTSSRWQNARRLMLSGSYLSGFVDIDGSTNVSLTADIADGALPIAKVGGLQTALDGKQDVGNYVTHSEGAGRTISTASSQPTSPQVGDVWFDPN